MISGIFLTVTGTVLLAIALYLVWPSMILKRRGIRVWGTVTEVSVKNNDGYYCIPTLRFETEDRKEFTCKGGYHTGEFACSVGDQYVVIYDPLDPRRAKEDSFSALFSIPLFIFAFAAIVLFIGIGFLYTIATGGTIHEGGNVMP